MKMMKMLLLSVAVLLAAASAFAGEARAEHLVILGIDGLGAYGLRGTAKTPRIDSLREAGASTYHARGVLPTDSSPNWASMIMGAGPELHGITSNSWKRDNFDIPAAATGPEGIFPTIFGVLRAQRPASRMAFFTEWNDFPRLIEGKAVDEVYIGKSAEDTAERAAAVILESKPNLVFVQLDHVDHAGHEFGHESPQYFTAIEEADALVGKIVDALREAGISDRTIILITADHGGTGKGHGKPVLRQLEIPWIISGPGVARGKRIESQVLTYDTAATAAYVLGLDPPAAWRGRPVTEAFTK